MQEIKCPHCGEVFQVDEAGYAAIVKQVRDKEFHKELQERQEQFLAEKRAAVDLAVSRLNAEKTAEVANLQNSSEQKASALKQQITSLQSQLEMAEANRRLAVSEIEHKNRETLAEKE